MLPLAPEGDPKRHGYQFQIQQQALVLDIDQIVAKFMPSGHVSRRINLGNAGQPRRYFAPDIKSRNGVIGEISVTFSYLDLVYGQRARTHPAHLPFPDIENLRHFIETGCSQKFSYPGDSRVIFLSLYL